MPGREKLRMVLDYVPCEACLEVPVDDQELHCSICRRTTREVTVRRVRDVAVLVEAPAPPPEPAPVVVPAPEASAPPPAPVAIAAEATAAADEDERVELGWGATAAQPEDNVEVGFDATRAEEEPPAAEAAPQPEEPERREFVIDADELEGRAAQDELEREAEAWAEATVDEEEVDLVPVTPEELAAASPEPPVEEWPEEPAAAEAVEVLEVVEEEPLPTEPAAPPAQEFEVLEVLEEEPLPAEPAAAAPAEPQWQDEPWPEEPGDAVAAPADAAPAPPAEEAWAEDAAAPESAAAAAPVDDPVTLLPDVGPLYAERLQRLGVQRVRDLVGRDARGVAKETGIAEKLVRRWVRAADLVQAGVPVVYADLLVRAGYDTPRALRKARPDKVVREVNRLLGDGEETAFAAPIDADTVRRWQA